MGVAHSGTHGNATESDQKQHCNFMFVLEQMCFWPVMVPKCVCVCLNMKNEGSDVLGV